MTTYSISPIVKRNLVIAFVALATLSLFTSSMGGKTSHIEARDDSSSDNLYGFVPDLAANAVCTALFGTVWFIHTVLFLWYREFWFGICMFIGCGLETAGYIGRTISASNPTIMDDFLVQIICLTLAPAFTSAAIYSILGKLVAVYGRESSRLSPLGFTYLFCTCDLISIVIQAAGGGMAATAVTDGTDTSSGTHVMVAGIAFQVVSMTLFIALCIEFGIRIHRMGVLNGTIDVNSCGPSEYVDIRSRKNMVRLQLIMGSIAVIFIYIRCIYRVVELAEGWDGYLISHEVYLFTLDGLMILISCIALIIGHPGYVFQRHVISVAGSKTA